MGNNKDWGYCNCSLPLVAQICICKADFGELKNVCCPLQFSKMLLQVGGVIRCHIATPQMILKFFFQRPVNVIPNLWDLDMSPGVAHGGLWPMIKFITIIDLIGGSWTRMTQHMYVFEGT